ncbi:MAG: hypothetical protein FWB85_01760 [Chitinispirillia bacterium]|nr:hypothetical protein [Chitinispirillia bacterium]MCL2241119.1 hypothetical protein [Chitinispirillia bacterium]
MRKSNLMLKLALVLALAAGSAFAQKAGDAMQAKKANTSVYANEVREAYESPVGSIGPSDVVSVTEVKRNHLKIRTSSGIEGFVERKDLSKASNAAAKNRAFAFEAAEVVGYLDNPTPIYIIDMDDPNADPISLDRSFKEALKENVDKETMDRLAR